MATFPANPVASAAAPRRGASLIDPKTLMAIRNLELRARTVVQGFWSGIHRSPKHGFSVEFTEYRQYSPGDDPRFLDWRAYARSDRFYLKRFEDETNLRCHLLADNSRSMTFGSTGWTKAEYANTLAATFACFLQQQGDAVGLLTFDERVRECLPARSRPGHLRRLMLALEKTAVGARTDLLAPLRHVSELVRKRSLLVLISDLFAPLANVERQLGQLAAAGHELIVFQVLDPAELRFPYDQPTLFQDLESEREMFVDPAAIRSGYFRKFEAHQSAIRGTCQTLGIHLANCATDQPLELMLYEFLNARMARVVKPRRLPARNTLADA